jgi:hypothetical protein
MENEVFVMCVGFHCGAKLITPEKSGACFSIKKHKVWRERWEVRGGM